MLTPGEDGTFEECVVNAYNLQTVPKTELRDLITELSPERMRQVREAIEFYKHRHDWSNRLIAGDSLLVMNSLLEKEGMAGQVQMVFIDPPYGIKYGSNFQPFVNRRDVKMVRTTISRRNPRW